VFGLGLPYCLSVIPIWQLVELLQVLWHAAWIADLRRHGAKPYPAPMAFAEGKSMATILAAVKGTGFITG
jgi:hypothetical protein